MLHDAANAGDKQATSQSGKSDEEASGSTHWWRPNECRTRSELESGDSQLRSDRHSRLAGCGSCIIVGLFVLVTNVGTEVLGIEVGIEVGEMLVVATEVGVAEGVGREDSFGKMSGFKKESFSLDISRKLEQIRNTLNKQNNKNDANRKRLLELDSNSVKARFSAFK